ncbi:MAG: hypothetical protein JWN60_2831, partial [Acidobacteria bacterium]|nr:hypothetical protein [Acidobacteriota bacterium]
MNIFIKIFACLVLFLTISAVTNGQKNNDDWTRIESENKEISFALPGTFSFHYDKEGFVQFNPKRSTEQAEFKNVRSITAFENGATMFFESYNVKNAKKVLSYFLGTVQEGKYQYISFENFTGLHILFGKSSFNVFYYLASEKNIYLIGYGAREASNETITKFLSTIKINGKPVFNSAIEKLQESNKSVSIIDIQETPLEIIYNLENSKKENKKKSDKKNPDKNIDQTVKPETTNENSKPFIVVFKPRSMYTDEARMKQEQGLIKFRAVFHSNGLLGKITIIKDLRY